MKTEPGQYPFVVTAAQRRTASNWQLEGPAVCIPLISSTGHGHASLHRLHYQEGKFALANLLVALIPHDPSVCNTKYLYYLLTAKKEEYLVRLMMGTANVSLKEADIADVEVALPPVKEQTATVARLDDLISKMAEASAVAQDLDATSETLLAVAFNTVVQGAELRTMKDVAPLVRRPVEISSSEEYPELGIRSFGKGTFHKEALSGDLVGTKRLFAIEPGDLVFNNVFAWEGAVAVVGDEDAGRFGSHRFMTCVPREGVASGYFLWYYFLTTEGLRKIGEASPGGAGRNRTLGLAALADIEVPVPDYTMQRDFEELFKKAKLLKKVTQEQRGELVALAPSLLSRVFAQQ